MSLLRDVLLGVLVGVGASLLFVLASMAFVAVLFALVLLPFPWNLLLLGVLGFIAGYFIE